MTEKKKKSKAAMAVMILLLVIVVGGSMKLIGDIKNAQPPEKEPPALPSFPVEVITVSTTRYEDMTAWPATLHAIDDVRVPAEIGGKITALYADKGAVVSEGDALLQIDDALFKNALAQSEIDLREAEKDLERWEELRTSGAVSVNEYEKIKTAAEMARIARDNASINIEKSTVTAPVSGQITDRYVSLGEFIGSGDPVYRLVKTDKLKLNLHVPENDVGSLHTGMPLVFSVKSLKGLMFTGTVTFVASASAAQSNTYEIEAVVDNADGILRAGMLARVAAVREVWDDAIVVPLSAVVPDKSEHVVFLYKDGYAVRQIVIVDKMSGEKAVIGSGIRAGDQLIVAGQRTLSDGTRVTISGDGEVIDFTEEK